MRRPALILLALCIALLAGGCSSSRRTPREATRDYLQAVNRAQQSSAADIKRANADYRLLARGMLSPGDAVSRTRQADLAVRTVRDRILGIAPPPPALRLRARMAKLFRLALDFTHQTAALAAYETGAESALRPVGRYNRELRGGLRAARSPAGQAALLDRFARRLDRVVVRLRDLHPPRVLSPSHSDQIRRLAATGRLAQSLAQALRAADSRRVGSLLERFAGEPGGAPRTALARRAITAYNRRYRQLQRAYADVNREYSLLDRTLG